MAHKNVIENWLLFTDSELSETEDKVYYAQLEGGLTKMYI